MSFGRTGDAILSVLEDGSISIEVAMGVKNPQVSLDYAYKAGCCFNFKGEVGALVEEISVYMRINVSSFISEGRKNFAVSSLRSFGS